MVPRSEGTTPLLVIAGIAVLGHACTGVIEPPPPAQTAPDGPSTPPPTTDPGPGTLPPPGPATPPAPVTACDPATVPDAVPLRRLGATEYRASVQSFLTSALGDVGPEAWAELQAAFGEFAEDERQTPAGLLHGGYRSHDQRVQQTHVDAYFAIGERAAEVATRTRARREAMTGGCDALGCLGDVVERLAHAAFRRPPTAAEVGELLTILDDGVSETTLADLVAVLLQSPQFLYLVEAGDPGDDTAWPLLTEHELAARLSFALWDAPPDERLLERASAGELTTTLAAEVDRMLADPRATDALARFARDWLWLDDVGDPARLNGTPVFDAFRDGTPVADAFRDAAVQDVVEAVTRGFREDRSLQSVLLDTTIYGDDPSLRAVYGPDQGQRAGLLTRPGLLISGAVGTRPILRGVFIRMALLCDPLPAPPEDVDVTPPVGSGRLSTREVTEELTEQPGSVCADCHATLINPLGFPLEAFDGIGRYRDAERLFDDAGEITQTVAIDTRTRPRVDALDDTEVEDAIGLADLVAASAKAETCFARQYLRHLLARDEHPIRDACAIEAGRDALTAGGSLKDALRAIVLRDNFRRRAF